MTHFAGKAAKALIIAAITTLLLAGNAMAAETDLAVAVGATTGSSLRLRSEPSTSSTIITHFDKGVALAVTDDSIDGWYKVRFDGKVGYVSADYVSIDQDDLFTAYALVSGETADVRVAAEEESALLATIKKGTPVTVNGFENGWYAVTCQYGTEGYIRSDVMDLVPMKPIVLPAGTGSANSIVAEAQKHLGTRYAYGGAKPGGFDCSGFTMYLYKQLGYNLPHTATGQWQSGVGTKIWGMNALQPGDLVFFNDPARNAGKACSHVAIYAGDGKIIHSSSPRSGGVIISDLTSGYYNRYYIGGIHV